MKTCKECGSQNNSRVKFCTTCGSILDDDDDIEETPEENSTRQNKFISVNDTEQKSVDSIDDFMDDTFQESGSIVNQDKSTKEEQKKREKEEKKRKKQEEKERKRRLKEERRRNRGSRPTSNLIFILIPSIVWAITLVTLLLWIFKVNSIFKLVFLISLGVSLVVSLILWFIYQYIHRTVLTDEYLESQKDAYKLVLAYIGPNYDKILSKGFSVPALLFGPFYLLYRKLNLIGVFTIIILDVLVFYFCTLKWYALGIIFYLLAAFILALFVNSIYLSTAKKKIDRIKLDYVNFSDMLDASRRTGGTSFVWIIIMTIILGVAVFFEAKNVLHNNDCEKRYENMTAEYKSYILDEEVITVPTDKKKLNVTITNDSEVNFSIVKYVIHTTYEKDGEVKVLATCKSETFLSPEDSKTERITCDNDTTKATSYDFEVVEVRYDEPDSYRKKCK